MRASVSTLGWLVLLVLLIGWPVFLLSLSGPPPSGSQAQSISLDQLALGIKQGRFVAIEAGDAWGVAADTENTEFLFSFGRGVTPLHALASLGVTPDELGRVRYTVLDTPPLVGFIRALAGMLPLLVMAGLWWLAAPAQATNNQLLSLGQQRARRFIPGPERIRFADVAGVDEAKQELQEIVEFLRFPDRFMSLGAQIPRGVLLAGPPGTGKTLLARAVAGEAGVPFFSMSGAEFVEIVVGVGASRVRDLFHEAALHAPAIVFVDEIDAIGRQRGAGFGSADGEREQTLNQILVEMDGFDPRPRVIVIAATNRPDVLDPALLRPGRFDRRVVVDAPDLLGREAILRVHARGKPLENADVNLADVARLTAGWTGADLANLMNEAAILAVRRRRASIGIQELDEAFERVLAGPEAQSRTMSATERQRAAYHEAGHALVMRSLADHVVIHRVSIVARGTTHGVTRALGTDHDSTFLTRPQLVARLTAALGGRAAEQLVFGDIAAGSEHELAQATEIARSMVTRFGMSRRLGVVAFGLSRPGWSHYRRHWAEVRNYSDRTAEAIDEEIRLLLEEGLRTALNIVTDRRATLVALATELCNRETLQGGQLERVLATSGTRSGGPGP